MTGPLTFIQMASEELDDIVVHLQRCLKVRNCSTFISSDLSIESNILLIGQRKDI